MDQILTVEPDETEALQVEEGEDLVTLLTCTPYEMCIRDRDQTSGLQNTTLCSL